MIKRFLAIALLCGLALVLCGATVVSASIPVVPVPVGHTPYDACYNPGSNKVYVANESDGTVSVIDSRTDTVIGLPIPVPGQPCAVAGGLDIVPGGNQ